MTTIEPPRHHFLSTDDLVRRWAGRVAKNTIVNWRGLGKGPRFVKVGHKVLYRLDHVEAWEATNTNGEA